MNEDAFNMLVIQAYSIIKNTMPVVTRNMMRNTTLSYRNGEAFITFDVPYATFVNYGANDHPKSVKLQKDYQFIERAIKNAGNIITDFYGGYVYETKSEKGK